jgi:hypothetical protein
MDHRNVAIRQFNAGILAGNRRVVPRRNLSQEDIGQCGAVEAERLDARKGITDHHRTHHGGQMEDLAGRYREQLTCPSFPLQSVVSQLNSMMLRSGSMM